MLTSRMIDAYNRSRAATREPTIQIILGEEQWQLPIGVYKDELLDGWYNDIGEQVDPETFWTVKDMEVAIGGDSPLQLSTEYDGVIIVQSIQYFTLYTKGMYKEIRDAYGFLVNGVRYRLSGLTMLPSLSEPALIQLTLRLFDETYMVL